MSGYFIDVIAGPASGDYVKIAPQETRVIGRSLAADLTIADELISAQHVIISLTDKVYVHDLSTTNGTLVHTAAGPAQAFRDAKRCWQENELLQLGSHLLQLRPAQIAGATVTRSQAGFDVVQLSPPHASPPPPPQMADPPEEPQIPAPRRIPWVAMATSASGGLLMAAIFKTAFLLIFSVLAPAGMLLQFLWEKRRDQKSFAQKRAAHDKAYAAFARENLARRAEGARLARLKATDPAHCQRQAVIPAVGLWQFTGKPVREQKLVLGLIMDDDALVPFHVSFRDGAVGIYGDEASVEGVARWLTLQIAINLAPSQIQISGPWDWLASLPHRAPRPEVIQIMRGGDYHAGAEKDPGIFYAENRSQLPAHCQTVINVHDVQTATCETLRPNQTHEIAHHCGITDELAGRLARELSPLRDRASVPRRSQTLAEIWNHPTTDTIISHWEMQRKNPSSLRCPIGTTSTDRKFFIDLASDGPHALIGGTTGSGKSVLQRTLVTSLALSQRPEHLAIVLVDYKGGAAFRCLERLPHVIETVTDLDKSATVRTLQSLRAELRRREFLLAEHGLSDHEQLTAAGLISRAPRLVIVVDELRALHDEHPELLNELVQLAALGRSLGIHLILATQRPGSSVNSDMRANINMRIALRVQSGSDSHDILESPAAAQLPSAQPGAAIVRLGAAEPQELQVAAITDSAAIKLAKRVSEATDRIEARPPRRPWLPPLPAVLTTIKPSLETTAAPLITAGLRDHPAELKQDPLVFDPNAGHLVLAGGSGSGRTTALRVLARHSSLPVHVIARDPDAIVDPHAPWVGTRLPLEDHRLIRRLMHELRAQNSQRQLLLIDGADSFLEADHEHGWEHIHQVLREGMAQQITLVLAGGRLLLGPRISELIAMRWVLNWPDDTALTSGAIPRDTPMPAGPGGMVQITAEEIVPARIRWVPSPGRGEWDRLSQTAELSAANAAPTPPILRLQPLPRAVSQTQLPPVRRQAPSINPGQQRLPTDETTSKILPPTQRLTFGIGGDHANPIGMGLEPFLIAGPAGSGRTNLLRVIAGQCAEAGYETFLISGRAPAPGNVVNGVRTLGADHFAEWDFSAKSSAVLLIDDLDMALNWEPHASWITSLRARIRAGKPTIATATIAASANAYSGILAELRRNRSGVVLHPAARMANDVFGVDVASESDGDSAPAGRGVVVESGRITALQTAHCAQWSSATPPA